MTKYLKLFLLALALVFITTPSAHAFGSAPWGWTPPPPPPPPPPGSKCPPTAPEVDPGLALSGLTLLGGTLTVLRSRRQK